MSVSPDLLWSILRNNSCYLLKANGRCYSRDPNNLKSKNSFRYNGLIHKKTVGIEPCKDGKGVVMVTCNSRAQGMPSKKYTRVELKAGGRKTLSTIRRVIRKNKYRKDLKMAAVRRASALLQSQKPVAVRKTIRKRGAVAAK